MAADGTRRAVAGIVSRNGLTRSLVEKGTSSSQSNDHSGWRGDLLARLLRYYVSCIEEEDLRSLTLHIAQRHEAFISPWNHREVFFHHGCEPVRFHIHNEWEQMLIRRGSARAGEAERFFYGYPLFLDVRDTITPLFFMEVTVREERKGEFVMEASEGREFYVNDHFFRHAASGIEELLLIQEELEGPFPDFAERLEAAFDFLRGSPTQFHRDSLDPFPGRRTERDLWLNRPLLFRSDRNRYTSNLRRELGAFLRYDRLLKDAPETAMNVFFGGDATFTGKSDPKIVEVLTLNGAQEEAVRSGRTEALTVVTGPPGTGKSQVVVDLLLSCARAGERVLFASKNNKAVDTVRDRIRAALGSDNDWTLRFGNLEQMRAARENLSMRLVELAPRSDDAPDEPALEQEIEILERRLSSITDEVERIRVLQADLETAERTRRETAARVSEAWIAATEVEVVNVNALPEIQRIGREIEEYAREIPSSIGIWLRRLFMGKSIRQRLGNALLGHAGELPVFVQKDLAQRLTNTTSFGRMLPAVHQLVAYQEWIVAQRRYNQLLGELRSVPESSALAGDYHRLKEEVAEKSRRSMLAWWRGQMLERRSHVMAAFETYFDVLDRLRTKHLGTEYAATMAELNRAVDALANLLPVWIVTNLSVRRALPLEAGTFDLVVIDEASQCDIPSAIPLLFRARRAVVIGDPKQLRHVSSLRSTREQRMARDHGLPMEELRSWSYVHRSIYDAAARALRDRGGEPVFLAEHYRSHPSIIEFSNHAFYGGRLIPRVTRERLEARFRGHELGAFWYDVKGEVPPSSRSAWNEAEIAATLSLFSDWWRDGLLGRDDVSFGVVTPFRSQADRIELALQRQPWWPAARSRIVVGTAHRFQGDECDVMVFSPVVAEGLGERSARWVAETEQLLNVAVTRARAALHVVGDFDACIQAGSYLARFANYVVTSGAGSEVEEREHDETAFLRRLALQSGLAAVHLPELRADGIDLSLITPFGFRYDIVQRNEVAMNGREQGMRQSPVMVVDPDPGEERQEILTLKLSRLV